MTSEKSDIASSQPPESGASESARAKFVRDQFPTEGLFAGNEWHTSPAPFPLEPKIAKEIDTLGRVLLQFYRAVNLLYRKSVDGKQPEWIARWLDQGKPRELIDLQRSMAFKNEVPRVIRPDILLTEGEGLSITELDSVPGGIGLTAWLNQVYCRLEAQSEMSSDPSKTSNQKSTIIGGPDGMIRGFESIFGDAKRIHIVVSEEAATYRPEMEWLAKQMRNVECLVRNGEFSDFRDNDAVYRFFELFDLPNIPNSQKIFALANEKKIRLTPPPRPVFEEKMLFALLWNRNLRNFWRQELGEGFFNRLLRHVPFTWIVDPAPMPPHAAIPEINLTDWQQLKQLSQKDRDLILKISGFSPHAWGARGVYLGSDLSHADWSAAVDKSIADFPDSPYVLQRYHKPGLVEARWFDFERNEAVPMKGRVRLCPYYFVAGDGDTARATLGGVLATICPADKKIIHGMTDAILAPCAG